MFVLNKIIVRSGYSIFQLRCNMGRWVVCWLHLATVTTSVFNKYKKLHRYYAPIYVNIEYCSGSYGQHSNPQYKVIYGQILRMGLHVRGVEAKLWQVHWCRSGWWRRLMVAIMFMTLAGLCYDDNVRLRCGGYNVYNVATTDVTLVGCGMLKKYKRIKHESKAPIDHPLNDSRTTP